MPSALKLSGMTFGRLRALSQASRLGGEITWNCVCECGQECVVRATALRQGHTKSCGCRRGGTRKRGDAGAAEYRAWKGMLARCRNPTNKAYQNYGGRGITVAADWDFFDKFYADMGPRPLGGTIDRIKNDKGYEPGNCRWATTKEQARNRRSNALFTFNGETKCVAEWAEAYGLKVGTLWQRLKAYGMPIEKALTAPVIDGRFKRGAQP